MPPVKNLEEFKLDLGEFLSKQVPEAHLALQKKIALDLLRKIVLRTPVGNPDLWKNKRAPKGYVGGRARAAWQVSLDVEPGDAAPVKLSPDASGNSSITDGTVAILGLDKPYGVIWIFNNLPYIVRLENGWSRQAPSGMVQLSVQEMQSSIS